MTPTATRKTTERSPSAAALEAHSWLGLAISAAMYLICLSGTLAVINQEFERWEQPSVLENPQLQSDLAARALGHFVARYGSDSEHLHLVFPTSGIPRLVVENDDLAHFVNSDGSLGLVESSPWTSMLIDLHYYLHLPSGPGIILVSACGALLLALLISGVLAHKHLVKDAFRLRLGGNGTQQSIDLHNRLSVWGLPFHLMISLTGAYYGLVGVLMFLTAQAFYGGDLEAVSASVFTPEPQQLGAAPGEIPDIVRAMDYVRRENPAGKPIFLTVHDPATEQAFIEVFVQQRQRLIYAENYRFNTAGDFIGRAGYRDGAAGKQLVYSLYRIHFGDFAGLGTKLLYFILGMMLTVISASGMDIWLRKRKRVDVLNALWPAFVWGAPIALCLSALVSLYFPAYCQHGFWITLAGLLSLAARWEPAVIGPRLRIALSIALGCLLLAYLWRHGQAVANRAAWPINLVLVLGAVLIPIHLLWRRRGRRGEPAEGPVRQHTAVR